MARCIVIIAIISALIGCSTHSGLTSTIETNSSLTEEYDVYSTLLKETYLADGFESIVIKEETSTDLSPGESLDSAMKYIEENMSSVVKSDTMNDFKTKNRQSQKLGQNLFSNNSIVLLNEKQFDDIFELGDGWEQFYETYPNSQGIMTLSRVGFSAEMDQALVYMGNQADYLAGRGHYVLLIKEADTWSIQDIVVAWIS